MKKISKILCSSILSAMLITSNLFVVNAKTNDNEIKVKNIVHQYFNNGYKIMQTYNTIDSSSIIKNENFKKYVNTKNSLIADWYRNINEKLNTYKIYIDYDSIKFNGNVCTVNLREGSDMVFVNSPEITQKSRNEQHIITLNQYNNKWFIEKDVFDDVNNNNNNICLLNNSDTNYNNNLNNEIDILETKRNNVKIDAEKYLNEKNLSSKSTTSNTSTSQMLYSSYNASAAVNYAETYWGPSTSNWNQSYSKYGSDCTNFVSQCIRAGGIPTDGTWYKDSNAWIRVIELRNWLVSKGYVTEYVNSAWGKEGDIIQLYNPTYGWEHSLIVTFQRSDGQEFITCHTTNHLNYALFNYYPTSSWTNVRTLKLTH